MTDLLQNPGYLYDLKKDAGGQYFYELKDNFSINTLIIFFDYFMSLQGRKQSMIRGGTLIRKEQYHLITDIISKECDIKCGHKFYQLIMGAGKSAYIAPLLSLLLIAGGKYSIHVLPDYLVNPAIDNFNILKKFGITTISKKISRKSNNNIFIFDEIDGINTNNINYVFSDASIKSILLNAMSSHGMTAYYALKERLSYGFLIFDEVDDISHPFKCELNYPITGEEKKIKK